MAEQKLNQFSKEIFIELSNMAKKYNIVRGMLLFEEEDKDDKKLKRHRVMIFDQLANERKDLIREFGKLFVRCANISRTLMAILKQANEYSIKEAITTSLMSTPKKRVD
jgi:hypothetical protein